MSRGTVVLLGKFSVGRLALDPRALDPLAAEFGWSIETAPCLSSLRRVCSRRKVVAVLIGAEDLGISWQQALRSVQPAVPEALAIACRRFSDTTPWTELADAGAFHELRLPFDRREIRQVLGFVWAAQKGSARIAPARVLRMPRRKVF
jgi:hypothetical protein